MTSLSPTPKNATSGFVKFVVGFLVLAGIIGIPYYLISETLKLAPLAIVLLTIQYGFAISLVLWLVLAFWHGRLRFRRLRILSLCCALSPVIVIGLFLVNGSFIDYLAIFFIPIHVVLLVLVVSMTIYLRRRSNKPLEPTR